jgi:hypothetical protein
MKLWKVRGVAGLAGVAATGAIIARDQRQRAHLTPDEVRERLRRRVAEATAADADPAGSPPDRAQPGSTDSSARA